MTVVVTLALLSLGCAHTATIPALVLGPYDTEPSRETFELILTAIRTQGYEPSNADASTGVITVPTLYGAGRDLMNVTCLDGGWIRITPSGPDVGVERVRDGNRYSVPGGVQREIAELAVALRRDTLEGS